MIFHSFEFLFLFFPIVCLVYFRLPAPLSRWWLAAASFFFYGYWDPRFVPLLAVSAAFNFAIGRRVPEGRWWLYFGIAGNLAALVYFKYAGFFFGVQGIVLPLGISFFTFTQIAYLLDLRSEGPRRYSLADYSLFVAYFPHLLAGPILHHAEMMPQLQRPPRFAWERFTPGLALLAAGLAKKVLIADPLAPVASQGFAQPAGLQFASAWVAALAYAAQIYFDFSGYTDMARGMSKMLGIEMPVNFNSPYQARNLAEFWRRWHITLSRFLRDYVFYAVGGASRRSEAAPYFAALVTFGIAGLWHGANWTFVVWGLLHGLGVVVVRLWRWTLPTLLARALTFAAVTMLWVWFRASTVADALTITKAMLSPRFSEPTPVTEPLVLLAVALVLAWTVPNSQKLFERPALPRAWSIALGAALALSIASLQHATEFLYFNF